MFQFPAFASQCLFYSALRLPGITLVGFPHSGIFGSTPACGSPKLIAANHALHRLSTPRHPPCALSSLTIKPFAAFGLQGEGQGSTPDKLRQELCPGLRLKQSETYQDASRIRTLRCPPHAVSV